MNGHWKDFLVVDEDNTHLGGNLHHGDGQTITPRLWQTLVERFAPRSILDVGAGEGHATAFFSRQGVVSHGFDGLLQNIERAQYPIALHDLKKAPYVFPCDLVYRVEVVEHIEEVYLENLLATLANAPVIVMTHALPGQSGHHHVNIQPPEYWIEKLGLYGYRLATDLEYLRSVARVERQDSYFAESGLVFLKANNSSKEN
jgi:hypothetical protein